MLIPPGFDGFGDGRSKRREIHQRATPFVIRTANGHFRQITVAVPFRVVAFAVKGKVFSRGELICMQAVSGAKGNLHSQKISSSLPILGKEIIALI